MKVKTKLLIILIILMIFLNTSVYAIEMFLDASSFNNAAQSYDQSQTTTDEDNLENLASTAPGGNTNNNTTNQESSDQSTPTITSTVRDNSLTISDIINIILIAVCIVLILLAIAILIRCK